MAKPLPKVSPGNSCSQTHFLALIEMSRRRGLRQIVKGHEMSRHSDFVPVVEAMVVPLPQAPSVFGLSRSAIYRAAAQGHVTLLKMGRSTLVDAASVRSYLASLPRLMPKSAA
jgi:predicted DNA-binding transcriptional regulator AlpA